MAQRNGKPVQVYLSDEVHDTLTRRAESESSSVATLVRQAVERFLCQEQDLVQGTIANAIIETAVGSIDLSPILAALDRIEAIVSEPITFDPPDLLARLEAVASRPTVLAAQPRQAPARVIRDDEDLVTSSRPGTTHIEPVLPARKKRKSNEKNPLPGPDDRRGSGTASPPTCIAQVANKPPMKDHL